MEEMTALEAAVEELHEPDRLLDLCLLRLRGGDAPPELIEQGQRFRRALQEWQEQ